MHNSSTTKIQLESKNDFYDALEDINEVSDQIIKHSFKKENTELEHLVRKRMNDFIKELAEISASNIQINNNESIDLKVFDLEPFDVLLDEQVDGVQEQVQSLLENIIYQRRSAIGQLEPLAKEVVSHQASVDQTFSDNNTNSLDNDENNQEEQESDNLEYLHTILKEYQEALELDVQLDKTLVETKLEVEQLIEVLKTGKSL
ncbi:hypothetical protein BDC45DRAFT_515470 [Circinella umbellata]|nr:hypothetical protein BDC45DRAFT_515470 [Circinella umbellata]